MKKLASLAALAFGLLFSAPSPAYAYNDNCAAGNLWSAATVLVSGTSTSVLIQNTDTITITGHASGATVLSILISLDDATYYTIPTTIVVLGSADFSTTVTVSAYYVKLQSSGAATITANACGGS